MALGAVLFGMLRLLQSADGAAPPVIVITAADIAEMRRGELERRGRAPTAVEIDALVEAAIVDEILYREALARRLDADDAVVERRLVQNMRFVGDAADSDPPSLLRQARAADLQRGDPVIRRRLVQKMRVVLEREGTAAAPTEAELRSYFETHAAELATPPSVELTQIFHAGPDALQSAGSLLAELQRFGVGPERAVDYGDVFFAGTRLPPHSQRSLSKLFGEAFAAASMALPVGKWSGPVRSAYGAHLVWIHERIPGQTPPFEAVRGSVRERILAARAASALHAGIARLRRQYSVSIAPYGSE